MSKKEPKTISLMRKAGIKVSEDEHWEKFVKRMKSREEYEKRLDALYHIFKREGLIPLYKDIFPKKAQKYRKES
jgi:RNAse (barnase) inhibitor barstar